MNPLRIPSFIARGITEWATENIIAMAEVVQLALIATKPRRP